MALIMKYIDSMQRYMDQHGGKCRVSKPHNYLNETMKEKTTSRLRVTSFVITVENEQTQQNTTILNHIIKVASKVLIFTNLEMMMYVWRFSLNLPSIWQSFHFVLIFFE